MRFPELALSCLLIGHANDNEYLTVDSASLLQCPGSDNGDADDETCWHSVDAHLCLAHGILPPQPRVSIDESQLSWSTVTAETVILRLSSLLKQLSVSRLKTDSATCHGSMCYFLTS